MGNLYVELGSADAGAMHVKLPLNAPGEIRYAVQDVWTNGGHELDAFNVLRFVFEAQSTEFSFTLDEIRLVPEPGTCTLAAMTV